MKLLHLSDLHIGKRVEEVSLVPDQQYILDQILKIIDEEAPDAVLIAGDVYDKSVPSAEAVTVFDEFLCSLSRRKLQTFIISGNHDSAERLAFGGRLMELSGIHLSPLYDGTIRPITLRDEAGEVDFWLLPFLKPIHVRQYFKEAQIESYTDACRVAVENFAMDKSRRNVLLAHQFVTGASICDSEERSVGGMDNVDAAVFADFDYVALGHIHGPQNMTPTIRYCGSPLKYSFSERNHEKSVTIAELPEKGDLQIRTVPLIPRHDMREIRGTFAELFVDRPGDPAMLDYLRIVLTDEEDIPEAASRLRAVYPNLMVLLYDNTRTRHSAELGEAEVDKKSPFDLFCDFYRDQNGQPMSDVQRSYVAKIFGKLQEENP